MENPRIFLSPPHMGGTEFERVREAFESNYIAPIGPMINAFEKEMAAYTGISHCVALSSGTAAMHLVLREMGVGEGDGVLASTLTFIGSVSPATWCGAKITFIDADPNTWNMDLTLLADELKRLAEKNQLPKVVIPTDLYGQPNQVDLLKEICDRYEVTLILDAAESLGAKYQGQSSGFGAKAAIFSYNGNKIITTSGGGLLASEDESLIQRARHLSTQAREPFPYYEHTEIGYNYRMSNICAAIGLGQMDILDKRVEQKRDIFDRYQQLLGDAPGISFMPETPDARANRWLTTLTIDSEVFGATPEEIRLGLEEHNIESRPVWKPMHLQPVFKDTRIVGGQVSEQLFKNGLCLPSGTTLTAEDQEKICKIIKSVAQR